MKNQITFFITTSCLLLLLIVIISGNAVHAAANSEFEQQDGQVHRTPIIEGHDSLAKSSNETITRPNALYCSYVYRPASGSAYLIYRTGCYSEPCFYSALISIAPRYGSFSASYWAYGQRYCFDGVSSNKWFYTHNHCWVWSGATSVWRAWYDYYC